MLRVKSQKSVLICVNCILGTCMHEHISPLLGEHPRIVNIYVIQLLLSLLLPFLSLPDISKLFLEDSVSVPVLACYIPDSAAFPTPFPPDLTSPLVLSMRLH